MSTTEQVSARLFVPHTPESAPEKSRPILENVKKTFGFIPNLMATAANNPAVLEGYLALNAVLLGVALKTISNYLDHISPVPLDQAFEAEKVR